MIRVPDAVRRSMPLRISGIPVFFFATRGPGFAAHHAAEWRRGAPRPGNDATEPRQYLLQHLRHGLAAGRGVGLAAEVAGTQRAFA